MNGQLQFKLHILNIIEKLAGKSLQAIVVKEIIEVGFNIKV
jgi:hypothetical protein